MMNAIAFIFARGGSKGLPGKNIMNLDGKPLIGWTIEHAKSIPQLQRIIVSTDSEEIADIARYFGAEAPFRRPRELSQDNSPEWLAWRHALNYLLETEGQLPDAMLSLPTTAPLRQPNDIIKCLDRFSKGDCDAVVTVTPSTRNPWFNMVRREDDGIVTLINDSKQTIHNRQQAPIIFDISTVAYVVRPEFVFSSENLFSGRVVGVEIPLERSIDIDTRFDFDIAEYLIKRNKKPK